MIINKKEIGTELVEARPIIRIYIGKEIVVMELHGIIVGYRSDFNKE